MSKEETVEVTLKLPKGLIKFLEDMKACYEGSVEEYLASTVINSVQGQLESDFIFLPKLEDVAQKYGINFDC